MRRTRRGQGHFVIACSAWFADLEPSLIASAEAAGFVLRSRTVASDSSAAAEGEHAVVARVALAPDPAAAGLVAHGGATHVHPRTPGAAAAAARAVAAAVITQTPAGRVVARPQEDVF